MTHIDGQTLPTEAIGLACQLTAAVHEFGPDDVGRILGGLTRTQLNALAVTLAAMVPIEHSPGELLAWNDAKFSRDSPSARAARGLQVVPASPATRTLAPHGTHAAFNRHRKRQEEPCDACWLGERRYQRDRGRERRSVAGQERLA